jgi:succinate dehydrogenase / fumarate reductase, cytochrome b subunit
METTTAPGGHAAFVRAKLGSLLAIAPLGIWAVIHVWNNLSVYKNGAEWQADVTGHRDPIALAVTSVVVLAPLLLHTLWGLGRLRTSRPNNRHYGTFENLTYLLQRLSAVGVLLFLGAHIWEAFLHPRLVEHQAERFEDIAGAIHGEPATLIVYLLGTLGVAYHLGNGIYGFAMSWGLATRRRSLRGFQTAGIVLFVVFLAMSWAAIYGLWSAGAAYPVPLD